MHHIRQRTATFALLVIVLASLSGCQTVRGWFGGDNRAVEEFLAANSQYKTESDAYAAAQAVMHNEWKAGRLKTEKWFEVRIAENAVVAATENVVNDLTEWIRERKKPERFEAHARVLRNAQAAMVALANEITTKTGSVSDIARERLARSGLTAASIKRAAA